MIRKDYVSRALIEYSKTINNQNYKWLNFNTFKNLEKKIINENSLLNSDAVQNLIDSLNSLEKEDNNNKIINDDEINANDILGNEIIDINSNNHINISS